MASLDHVLSKVGKIHPSTREKAIEIINAAERANHEIWFVWGMGAGEHSKGTALDLMVRNRDAGEWVRNYIWTNRSRLRVKHVIWAQTITSTVKSPGVRRRMADRGNTTANHYDHNHVLFLDTAPYVAPRNRQLTASRSKPRPAGRGSLRRGSTGQDVRRLQRALNATFPAYCDLAVDSRYGPATERAVKEFQSRSGLDDDGVCGPKTQKALAKHGIKL